MFHRFYPYTSFISRKLRRHRKNDESAYAFETVHPVEEGIDRGIDIAPADRAMINGTDQSTDLETEMSRIESRKVEHQATEKRVFENVYATQKGIFTLTDAFYQTGRPSPRDLELGECPVYENGFHAVPPIAMRYFGHWLLDALPATFLREDEDALFLPYDRRWSHALDYAERLGLTPVAARSAFFRKLTVVRDVGMNANRRRRLVAMRSRIRESVTSGTARRVFLRRGDTGVSRPIANELELSALLTRNGFTEISVTDPLDDILAALRDAEVCVSMEGSHLAHAIAGLPRGALLLALVPDDRFITLFADYCSALENGFAIVTAKRAGSSYFVGLDRVADALERNGIAIGSRAAS